jgi:beta-lactam-binding protein with PASTA domain
MRINFSSYLWVVPFLAFIIGYQSMRWLLYAPVIQTPAVLGLHIHDAIKQLSAYQLNVRILQEKEDTNLDEGTIISQSPEPGKKIKPHQSVFLVITRKPPRLETPHVYGLSLEKIKEIAQEKGLRLKVHVLESSYPTDTCFAQLPLPKEKMDGDILTVYISAGNSAMRIVPQFKHKKLSEVIQFLAQYNIKPQIQHVFVQPEDHDCAQCIITDQRPLAGSLIDLRKPLAIQLTVQDQN